MKKLLVTCLVILTVVSLTACGKNKDETKISDGYVDNNGDVYANQEVKEQTETDATETDATEAEETTESTSTKTDKESNIAEPLDMFYNVQQDPNALLVVDMNTVSIDGKLMAFPSDYKYVSEKFNNLYTIEVQKYTKQIPVTGEEVGESFEVHTTPTTGSGDIVFLFKSNTDGQCKLSEMKCYGFQLQGGNNTKDPVFTMALPHLITFGSSYDAIIDEFGIEGKEHTQDKDANYMIIYDSKDTTYKYKFVGYDSGLYLVRIEYEK